MRPGNAECWLVLWPALSLQVTHRGFVLVEHLVIAAECDTEDDGRDILKAVDPFLAFRSLAPNVKQPVESQGEL